jgi:hypothetical protein
VADEQSDRGFKVQDRRRFSASGEPIAEGVEDGPAREEAPGSRSEGATDPRSQSAPPLPEITFSTFVIGLSTQALVLLGEIREGGDAEVAADLAGAKQLIDILGMLQAKTRGNLDDAETGLLDNALYDLRMRFVERSRSR